MDIEQDYIMRLIGEMVKVIKVILEGKKKPEEVYADKGITTIDGLQSLVLSLADKGKINEAENLLFNKMDSTDINQLYVVLAFYEHINNYSDEFLITYGYSRNEIIQGISDVARVYGVSDVILELLVKI